ncbi:Mss4-like protein [Podospora fimiseda]|uniref:Mss4-like protein n=1 Tax=Podospora fimiseda TaxID=252190 RepID=A0AAN7BL82_9PEZI|nr:Mss4-like protein [Podospora fimiseda]
MSQDQGYPLSCQCGHISFKTPPRSLSRGMAHCHCTLCQKQSASAFGTSLYFPSSSVFPLSPELESKLSLYKHNDSESGNTMYCYFCPKCGVRIMHSGVKPDGEMREVMSFKTGLIDGKELDWPGMKAKHIWVRSAVMPLAEGWECYEKYPDGGMEKKEEEERKGKE